MKTKTEDLSGKVTEGKMHQFDNAYIYLEEDVKEHISNVQFTKEKYEAWKKNLI